MLWALGTIDCNSANNVTREAQFFPETHNNDNLPVKVLQMKSLYFTVVLFKGESKHAS